MMMTGGLTYATIFGIRKKIMSVFSLLEALHSLNERARAN
jgi:hypothetical protein